VEGIAARTSQGNVLTSQRSRSAIRDFPPRIESFQVLRFFERRSAGQVSKFKTGTQGQAVQFVEDRGSVTEGPTDTARLFISYPSRAECRTSGRITV